MERRVRDLLDRPVLVQYLASVGVDVDDVASSEMACWSARPPHRCRHVPPATYLRRALR